MATWKKVIVSGSSVAELSFAGTGILSGSGAVTAVTDTATIDLTLSAGSISGVVISGSIDQGQLATGAVTTAKLANDAVTSAKIAAGAVVTAAIGDSQVTTAKIADSNVTTAKLADASVTDLKIASSSIQTGHIVNSAVSTAKIADSAITSGKIAAGNVVAASLATDAVETAKIKDANVTTAKIADAAITDVKIASSSIQSGHIVDGAILNADINANAAIAYTKINFAGSTILSGSGAITAVTDSATIDLTNTSGTLSAIIISGSVDQGQLATGAVTTAKIADSAITSGKIAAGNIVNAAVASAAAIAYTKLDFGGSNFVSASSLSSPSQGSAVLTVNGVAGSTIDLGLQTGDSPTFAGLTVTGDLTVNGTTTTLNTSNLVVEDRFVFLNAGSGSVAPIGEGGIIVESGSAGSGTAFFFDSTDQRWGVAYGVASTATSVTAGAFMSTAYVSVANGIAASTAATAAGFDDEGNIAISADGEIYIYS